MVLGESARWELSEYVADRREWIRPDRNKPLFSGKGKQKGVRFYSSGFKICNLPWPRWTRKSTQLFFTCVRLAFRLATHLRWLWSSSNSYTSRREFFTVWPLNTSRHKVITSHLYMRKIWDFLKLTWWTCEPTCESVWPPIASPYASSGLANLLWLASPLPGLNHICPPPHVRLN